MVRVSRHQIRPWHSVSFVSGFKSTPVHVYNKATPTSRVRVLGDFAAPNLAVTGIATVVSSQNMFPSFRVLDPDRQNQSVSIRSFLPLTLLRILTLQHGHRVLAPTASNPLRSLQNP